MANTLVVDDQSAAGLDYFQSSFRPPLYDSRLVDTYYEQFYPVSGVRDVDNIRFSIPAKKAGKVLNINKVVVAMNVKMSTHDKSQEPAIDTMAAPCNNFTSAIIRSLNIRLNDTTACHISNYGVYSQLCYMLNSTTNDEMTWMKNLLFEKNTTQSWDDVTDNEGWKARREHFGAVVPIADPNNIKGNEGKFMFSKDAVFFIFQLQTYLPNFHFLPHW